MQISKLIKRIIGYNSIINAIEENRNIEQELLSAIKFNSTVCDSVWFRYKGISPGGSAVDYSFFYTLYRVLTSVKPQNILEFGLGQSSKMIHQYANYYTTHAVTVEHDQDWANFFSQSVEHQYNVNVEYLELSKEYYKETPILTYKNCLKKFQGQKFDLIIVDGPFGYMENITFSRPQIIELIPHCLTDNFVIILDDYDRKGEKNTVNEIFSYFKKVDVKYVCKEYGFCKKHILITTPQLKFLTTL